MPAPKKEKKEKKSISEEVIVTGELTKEKEIIKLDPIEKLKPIEVTGEVLPANPVNEKPKTRVIKVKYLKTHAHNGREFKRDTIAEIEYHVAIKLVNRGIATLI